MAGNYTINIYRYLLLLRYAVAQLVEVLCYKSEGRGFDSQWPSGLRRGSAADHLQEFPVRIPPRAWMFVLCK
jgi:hypothetical protein